MDEIPWNYSIQYLTNNSISQAFSDVFISASLRGQKPISLDEKKQVSKVRSQKEKTILFGKFSQHGGGDFPNPKTFVNLPSIFLYAKFILRC